MNTKVKTVSICFINGDIAVNFGGDHEIMQNLSLLITNNNVVTKIKPYFMQKKILFFSLSKIPYGTYQSIQFSEKLKIVLEPNNHVQVLPNAVLNLVINDDERIRLNKVSRSEFLLLSPNEFSKGKEILFELPAVKLIDKIVLFDSIERWRAFENNAIGDFGYLIHTTSGTNYFKALTNSRKLKSIESQINFIAEEHYVSEGKLKVKLALPIKLEHATISMDDLLINAQVNGNELAFDFSQLSGLSFYRAGNWKLHVVTDYKLLVGELSFSQKEQVYITQNIVISDRKLRTIGDLKFQKLPSAKFFKKSENIVISIIENSYGLLRLKFPSKTNQAQLILKRRGENIFKRFNGIIDSENNIISFNMSFFFDENEKILNGRRWDIYILVYTEGEKSLYHLSSDTQVNQQKHLNYSRVIGSENEKHTTYDQKFQYYITQNNHLALVKNSEAKLIAERFNLKTELSDLKMKINGKFLISVCVHGESLFKIIFNHVLIVNRNTQVFYKIDLPTKILKSTNREWVAQASLKLDNEKMIPFYWDIFIEIVDEHGSFSLVKIERAKDKVRSLVRKQTFLLQARKSGQLLAPYVTVGNNLAFVYHPIQDFETRWNYFKESLARVIEKIFRVYFKNKHIWISYEKNAMGAHDNAFAFFEYMYNHKLHDQFYYVIRKDSPEVKKLLPMNNRILIFMSMKYFIYMFSSELFISSDTKYHGYNLHQRDSYLGRRMSSVKEVYLQHGVNGLKQVPAFHKKRGLLDYIVVPDEYEKRMVIDQWGYSDHQVAVTGLARWDKYFDLTDTITYRQIFVMPTWRKWMDGMAPEEFVKTPFYQQYQQFLSSTKLKNILIKNNIRIAFFLHPYFKDYVHLFNVDESIIDQHNYLDVDMGQEIQKSSMMISDYSSVLWDMYYLKKPVIFFQFDKTEYLETEKSYMDYETELFGDQTFDFKSTIDVIEEYIQRNFLEKQKYMDMRMKYFTYMDRHNSERIYDAIKTWKK